MERRRAMQRETRMRIVAAARTAFATEGYGAASMDAITAEAGVTRGALYHNFGGKPGLMQAVVDEIDAEMLVRMHAVRDSAPTRWDGFIAENLAYIEMALEPEIQRIMLLDGPAVLGDPSNWPSVNACLQTTTDSLRSLIQDRVVKPVDPEGAARLVTGAALSASLWIASAPDPEAALTSAKGVFVSLAEGLLTASPEG